ncbi:MAG: restriction endonuclease subunit S, partial [Chitinispirillales bacterium]|nr:restriction endonuclease subunit S [Chitinispirillales bacterium]
MRVKLGDVAVENRETFKGNRHGVPIVGLEHLTPQEVNLNEWDADTENTFNKMFRKGQVLFGRRRAYLKKAAVAPCDGICSGDITVIAAKPDALTPKLLPFIIQNDGFFDFAIEKSAGSMSPRAKWEHLREFEFNLPPIDEQRRLAEVLWAFDETKQAYKRLLKLTDELVKCRFVEMFGDGEFPRVELRSLCSLITKGTTPTTYGYDFVNSGVNFIKIENITENGEIDSNSFAFITEDCHEKQKRSQLQNGDILFSIAGAIGRAAIIQENVLPANTNQALAIIRLENAEVNRRFLLHALNSKEVKLQYELQKQGIAQLNLSLQNIGDLVVPFPPLSLQIQFADFVRATNKSK